MSPREDIYRFPHENHPCRSGSANLGFGKPAFPGRSKNSRVALRVLRPMLETLAQHQRGGDRGRQPRGAPPPLVLLVPRKLSRMKLLFILCRTVCKRRRVLLPSHCVLVGRGQLDKSGGASFLFRRPNQHHWATDSSNPSFQCLMLTNNILNEQPRAEILLPLLRPTTTVQNGGGRLLTSSPHRCAVPTSAGRLLKPFPQCRILTKVLNGERPLKILLLGCSAPPPTAALGGRPSEGESCPCRVPTADYFRF